MGVTAIAGVEKVGNVRAAVKGVKFAAEGVVVKTNGETRVEWHQEKVNAAVTNEIAEEFKAEAKLGELAARTNAVPSAK